MHVYTGTSGFSYPEWKGVFYPEKIKARDMLGFYAQKLGTVEINNTFYRMPKRALIEGWVARVPPGFLFSVKASRRITHFKKLVDTTELLGLIVEGLSAFGATLGPVLFQTPPTLRADRAVLEAFLDDVGQTTSAKFDSNLARPRWAFEFRHPSWFSDDIFELLSSRNAALVGGDVDDEAKSPPLVPTGRHLYLRLRKTTYAPRELETWAEQIQDSGVEEAFVYFKHEQLGPCLALRLGELTSQGKSTG